MDQLDELDELEATLNNDLKFVNIPNFKGVCATCGEPCIGDAIYAMDKTFHKDHFVCCICNVQFGTNPYYVKDGKPYCQKDYENDVLGICEICGKPLKDELAVVGDKKYHMGCFKCSVCGNVLNGRYYKKDGLFLCQEDYEDKYLPVCGRCHDKIRPTGDVKEAICIGEKRFHVKCFCCYECQKPFDDMKAYPLNDEYFCEEHYKTKREEEKKKEQEQKKKQQQDQ